MATSGDLIWPPVGTFSWPRTSLRREVFAEAVQTDSSGSLDSHHFVIESDETFKGTFASGAFAVVRNY